MSSIESSPVLLEQPTQVALPARAESGSDSQPDVLRQMRVDDKTSDQELAALALHLKILIRDTTDKMNKARRMDQLQAVTAEQQRRKDMAPKIQRPWDRLLRLISRPRGGQDPILIADMRSVLKRAADKGISDGSRDGTDLVTNTTERIEGVNLLAPVKATENPSNQVVQEITEPESQVTTKSAEPQEKTRAEYREEAQKSRDISRVQAELQAKERATRDERAKAEQEEFVQTHADRILTEFRTRFPYREVTGQELIMFALQDSQLKDADILNKMKVVDRALQLWEKFNNTLQKVKSSKTVSPSPTVQNTESSAPTRQAEQTRVVENAPGGLALAHKLLQTVSASLQTRRNQTSRMLQTLATMKDVRLDDFTGEPSASDVKADVVANPVVAKEVSNQAPEGQPNPLEAQPRQDRQEIITHITDEIWQSMMNQRMENMPREEAFTSLLREVLLDMAEVRAEGQPDVSVSASEVAQIRQTLESRMATRMAAPRSAAEIAPLVPVPQMLAEQAAAQQNVVPTTTVPQNTVRPAPTSESQQTAAATQESAKKPGFFRRLFGLG